MDLTNENPSRSRHALLSAAGEGWAMTAYERKRNRTLRKAKKFRFAFKAGIEKFVPREDWPLRDLSCCYGGELAEMLSKRRNMTALVMLAEITRAHIAPRIREANLCEA